MDDIKDLITRLRANNRKSGWSDVDRLMGEAANVLEDMDTQLDVLVKEDIEAQQELAGYRALGTLEHLQGIVEAERDGRLVVMPCKVGDTVYILSEHQEVKGMEVKCIQSAPDGDICMQAECRDETEWCHCDGPCGIRFSAGNMARRNIFLTREEAEATLGDGGNE